MQETQESTEEKSMFLSNRRHALDRGILRDIGLTEDELQGMMCYIRDHNGYCDCQVLEFQNMPDWKL